MTDRPSQLPPYARRSIQSAGSARSDNWRDDESFAQRISGRRWRLRDELIGIVTLGLLGLIAASLVPYFVPGTYLANLDQARLHLGMGFVLCALTLFVLRAPRRGAFSLVCALGLLGTIGAFVVQASAVVEPDRAPEFSLISFNMLGTNPRGQEIAAYLADEGPDVVFALEAGALSNNLRTMRRAFPYGAGCSDPRCDMAIFSKHPLSAVEVLPFAPTQGRLIRVEVELAGTPVTLVAVHMTKPYWGQWHGQQLEQLSQLLAEIEGPVVLAGDFNSQPFVRAFRQNLVDIGQMKLASGLLPTWPAFSSLPLSMAGVAIDHVLVRGAVTPVEVRLIEDPLGSNHRGLLARFDLDGQ
jgi:endonuclease/exonuclease/phosphatase (EEP) superfamily protein YafD